MIRATLLALAGCVAACTPAAKHDPHLSNAPLAQRLAAADANAGSAIFSRCAACHTVTQGAGDRGGPALYGVVGRPVARGSDRFNYTAALDAVGGVWTFDRLDAWLTNPQHFAPGTNMTFAGLPDGMDRADVIRFLNDNGSNLPLPAATPRSRPTR